MATRREIFERQLPKEIADKAIRNAEDHWEDYPWLEAEESYPEITAKALLREAFPWEGSPEGSKYWLKFIFDEL